MLFVVLGHIHFSSSYVHDIIYWMHMPLFFMISGMLYNPRLCLTKYAKSRFFRLFLPYISWWILNTIIDGSGFSMTNILRFIYGGRIISGVYWFVTCLYFTSIIFAYFEMKLSKNKVILISITMAILAVLESRYIIPRPIPNGIEGLKYRVPGNLDVVLFSMFFYSIGFYYKDKFLYTIKECSDIKFIASALFYVITIYATLNGLMDIKLDMKYVLYDSFVFALLSTISAFYIIVKINQFIKEYSCSLTKILETIGKNSIPVMFSHRLIIELIEQHILYFNDLNIIIFLMTVLISILFAKIIALNQITKMLFIDGYKN